MLVALLCYIMGLQIFHATLTIHKQSSYIVLVQGLRDRFVRTFIVCDGVLDHDKREVQPGDCDLE